MSPIGHSLGPEDRYAGQLLFAFVIAVAAYLALGQRLFQDGDVGWHIQAGSFILRRMSVPATDPFSYTYSGHPWLAQEWLAEVIMAAVFRAGGWAGIALTYAAVAAATVYVIGRALIKRLPVRWALCLLFVICGLLHPHWLARPHLFGWALLAVWTSILIKARERDAAPPALAPLLMLVWANVHASYILGLGVAAAFTAEAAISGGRRQLPRWIAFLVAAAALVLVTPHGLQGVLYPFQVHELRLVSVLIEWRPTNIHDDKLFLITASMLLILIGLNWRKIHPFRIALLAAMGCLAIVHARHQMPFVIVASLVAAPLFRDRELQRQRIGLWWVIPALAVLALVQAATHFRLRDNRAFPLAALAHVTPELRSTPVFNSFSFGGPLILAGIRPYIDGRADMYGDRFTLDYVAALRGDASRFAAQDRRWHFGWVILAPNDELVRVLDAAPAWRRAYSDRWAVIFVGAAGPRTH